ncbi:MAG: hypothetical protein ACT4OY_08380 [Alphaproteobacteria bacterium]
MSVKVKFDASGNHAAIFPYDFSYLRGFAEEAKKRYAAETGRLSFLCAEFDGPGSGRSFVIIGTDSALIRKHLPEQNHSFIKTVNLPLRDN